MCRDFWKKLPKCIFGCPKLYLGWKKFKKNPKTSLALNPRVGMNIGDVNQVLANSYSAGYYPIYPIPNFSIKVDNSGTSWSSILYLYIVLKHKKIIWYILQTLIKLLLSREYKQGIGDQLI